MSDGSPNRMHEIFLQAREMPPGERTAFIERACGNDLDLRRGVAFMLAAEADPLSTLDATPDDHFPRIEGYQLQGRIGKGGMGEVWKAVQLATHRTVALKLLAAASFGSDRARRRFEREVELTAKLDHPHIARIYDSGEQHGILFYAMQLIRGDELDRYVAAHKLSRTQIIELMEVICRAVQHAHQKGVIHRDLKYSNILVDERGEPHVLDFGLAKGTDGAGGLSLDGAVAGTPAFMSPEQAAGNVDRLDTRSDVYTLGVILFHLLCGKFPHDVSGSALDVMRRINDKEPRRLSEIEPHVDRDLQALLAKTLDKDPNRRYASAGELADDLRRYLNHDPLVAQAPTLAYLLSKKLRRHYVPLSVAVMMLVVMACVLVYAYARILDERNGAINARIDKESQRQEADRQRDEAVRERAAAQAQRGEVERQRQLAVKALSALKEAAPIFFARSQELMKERNFAEALKNASYAADLVPDHAPYQLARANLLQSLYRFEEASVAYEEVLALQPDDAAAKENIDLSRRLAVEQREKGEPGPAILTAWQSTMERQKRFAEAMSLLVRINNADHKKQESIAQYTKLLTDAGSSATLGFSESGLLTLHNFHGDQHGLSLLHGIPIESANFMQTRIEDLTPLAGMPLKVLDISGTSVTDLRPLAGMALVALYCHNTKVSDLRPLSGMPLSVLDLGGSAVTDLSPLHRVPLTDLSLYGTAVTDLTPLRGMPLKRLMLLGCEVEDITPLKGMHLEELDLASTKVLEIGALRGMKLKTLSLGSVRDISALGDMPLTSLFLSYAGVADLRPLRKMPLKILGLNHSELGSADVLHYLVKLERLDVENAEKGDLETLRTVIVPEMRISGNLTDISPLRGKPLETLVLNCPRLTDLAPLEEMPLKTLALEGCMSLREVSPLLKCGHLERLSIPSQCRNVECLRRIPSLKYLSYDCLIDRLTAGNCTTAEKFWKQFDAKVSEK